MESKSRSLWAWRQFGIGALLFLTFCFAGGLAGYRMGFDVGRREGFGETREEKRLVTRHARVFRIEPLVNSSPIEPRIATEHLIQLIKSTIDPGRWNDDGGPNSMHVFEANRSIVVQSTGATHDQVAVLIEQLEGIDARSRVEILSKSHIASQR